MKTELSRRDFIKSSTVIGGALSSKLVWPTVKLTAETQNTDIVIAKGENPDKLARAAVDKLGGMKRFVSNGDKVVLLPNPQGRQIGTSTNPHIVAETIKMCLDAGAAEVSVCSIHGPGRWQNTGVIDATKQAGVKMFYPGSDKDWIKVDIPKGKLLKKTTIIKRAVENDVFINMPIAKHHRSARFTCNLKNLMGFNENNSWFHQGQEHLQQSIIDLASIFSPKLCIVDAFTILTENGPFGPGATASPKKVFAGTDMVAMDALCCGLIDINPQNVAHILGAHKLGLGQIELSKLIISNIE